MPYDATTQQLGMCPKEGILVYHSFVFVILVTTATFTLANMWKQPMSIV